MALSLLTLPKNTRRPSQLQKQSNYKWPIELILSDLEAVDKMTMKSLSDYDLVWASLNVIF